MKRAPMAERAGLASNERDMLSEAEKLEVVRRIAPRLASEAGIRDLRFLPSGALGASDSGHDVFFAGNARGVGVALKRFRRSADADHEVAAMVEAQKRGFRTLQLAGEGVYEVPGVGSILTTHKVSQFKTMNQIGWQDFLPGDPRYNDVAHTLRSIGGHVGRVHRARFVQGDLQLKNIAQTPPGKFVLFDLEGASFYDPDQVDDFTFQGSCVEELKKLTGSLVAHGFMGEASSTVFETELTNNLFEPYFAVNESDQVLSSMDEIVAKGLYLREQHIGKSFVPLGAGRLAVTAA